MFNRVQKISNNTKPNASIVLRWLGASWDLHDNMVSFLKNCWLEVYYFDREDDHELWENIQAISRYLQEIKDAVNQLIAKWKKVHLLWISFGWFLALKTAEDVWVIISSVAAIAPLIDPFTIVSSRIVWDSVRKQVIRLSDEKLISILPENIEALRDQQPKDIWVSGVIILWDKDGFENPENMQKIWGNDLQKHLIPGVQHTETTGHPKTQQLLQEFYARILSPKK